MVVEVKASAELSKVKPCVASVKNYQFWWHALSYMKNNLSGDISSNKSVSPKHIGIELSAMHKKANVFET